METKVLGIMTFILSFYVPYYLLLITETPPLSLISDTNNYDARNFQFLTAVWALTTRSILPFLLPA
ncbi:MAG: hypothetical protein WKG06_15245 [Segetibacter sp.]